MPFAKQVLPCATGLAYNITERLTQIPMQSLLNPTTDCAPLVLSDQFPEIA